MKMTTKEAIEFIKKVKEEYNFPTRRFIYGIDIKCQSMIECYDEVISLLKRGKYLEDLCESELNY